MRDYDPAMSFGAGVAEEYRTLKRGDEEACVEFLRGLAGPGPALELAIGTGRIALPLAARGVRVDGVDLSPQMLAVLRSRAGGAELRLSEGDFAAVDLDDRYRLIYVVFNSFFNLLTQDDQVRCFANVASHLRAGGAFVVEAFSPAFLHRLRDRQYVDAESIEIDAVRLDVARHDPVAQTLEESHLSLSAAGIRLNPIVTRYAWPSELDLMARLAGLRLRERWGDWKRGAYGADSGNVISVWEPDLG